MFEKFFITEKLWDGLPVFQKQWKHDVQMRLRRPVDSFFTYDDIYL